MSATALADPYRAPGIFARIFRRPNVEAVSAAVASVGVGLVQLNLTAFGAPTVPEPGDRRVPSFSSIRRAFEQKDVRIWGLSATYNMAHPDPELRRRETRSAAALVRSAPELGASVVTLCTGTRDPHDMWQAHPDNSTPSAWDDLRASLEPLLEAAREAGVRLGVEPEPANVVRDAELARRLLDELGADATHVGIVLDPANLIASRPKESQRETVGRAFDLLGASAVCIHAKDVRKDGLASGDDGPVDLRETYALRAGLPAPVPVILQDTPESDVPRALGYLRRCAAAYPYGTGGPHP